MSAWQSAVGRRFSFLRTQYSPQTLRNWNLAPLQHRARLPTQWCVAVSSTLSPVPICVTKRLLNTGPSRPNASQPFHSSSALGSTFQSNGPASQTRDDPHTLYSVSDIVALTRHPSPQRLLIDVREPAELMAHGRIPGSVNLPINSQPEAFSLTDGEFRDRYGFERPGSASSNRKEEDHFKDKGKDVQTQGLGKQVEEVIFYCKAGVRSRAAARLAQGWTGVRIGEMRAGFDGWESGGGPVEKV